MRSTASPLYPGWVLRPGKDIKVIRTGAASMRTHCPTFLPVAAPAPCHENSNMRTRKNSVIAPAFPMIWWWDLAAKSTEMLSASAEVVLRRSAQISGMSNPPSAADQRELNTMVTEKVAAAQQSATAIMMSASSTASRFWWNQWMASVGLGDRQPASLAGIVASMSHSSATMLTAGLQPYRQRAMSNAKRLRERRPKR